MVMEAASTRVSPSITPFTSSFTWLDAWSSGAMSLAYRRSCSSLQVSGADGEDGGEVEGQLLGAHGLHVELVVHRRDVELLALLPGEHPRLLRQLHVVDPPPSDGQVLRRAGDHET
uniref:Uncharacterized protein n=1 Tax=Oryza brachyantha TaxID=4533 RepID=J3N3H6_ORYBR